MSVMCILIIKIRGTCIDNLSYFQYFVLLSIFATELLFNNLYIYAIVNSRRAVMQWPPKNEP